jgi:hypothetical protein
MNNWLVGLRNDAVLMVTSSAANTDPLKGVDSGIPPHIPPVPLSCSRAAATRARPYADIDYWKYRADYWDGYFGF